MKSGFFTRPPVARYVVPHDRIGERWILIAHLAVRRSFEFIRSDGFNLGAARENEITAKLEETLENRVRNRGEIEGFDGLFFGKVTRGNEVINHDGTKISKKPDLMFHLRREDRSEWDQRQDALFAECKPVDRAHTLVGHYCAVGKDCTGVERFVVGDYAWAMEEALMIGYVRDGFRLETDLLNTLREPSRHVKLGEPDGLVALEKADRDVAENPSLHRSRHKRLFRWTDGRDATPIDLYHSWHPCN
jgi:hypothetical protein